MMTSFEKWLTNLSTLIVGLSGLVYAWMKYLMSPVDPYAVVNHPLQPWILDAHVLAGPAMLFAIGFIAQQHIAAQIGKGPGRPGRGTGMIALWCAAPMVATGYLIQVFTHESARLACVIVHLVTGTVYLLMFIGHVIVSRRIAARRRLAAAAVEAMGGGPGNGNQVVLRRARRPRRPTDRRAAGGRA